MTCVNVVTMFTHSLYLGEQPLKCKRGEVVKLEFKDYYDKLGLNIVYYRKRLRLTQLQLAELVGIERSHISAIELGNVGVSLDVLFKMCEVLEIKPKDLFDFRD